MELSLNVSKCIKTKQQKNCPLIFVNLTRTIQCDNLKSIDRNQLFVYKEMVVQVLIENFELIRIILTGLNIPII